MGSETSDTLNFSAGVGFSVHSETVTIVFLAVTKVDSARQFADDVEVHAAADVGFEGGDVDERRGGEAAGSEVTECTHFFAEFEDALFGADGAVSPFLSYISSRFHFLVVLFEDVGIRTGPPMAPRITASAFLAAVKAASVKGSP
jgi:hypothetical protein